MGLLSLKPIKPSKNNVILREIWARPGKENMSKENTTAIIVLLHHPVHPWPLKAMAKCQLTCPVPVNSSSFYFLFSSWKCGVNVNNPDLTQILLVVTMSWKDICEVFCQQLSSHQSCFFFRLVRSIWVWRPSLKSSKTCSTRWEYDREWSQRER